MENKPKYCSNQTQTICDICNKPIKPGGVILLWNDSFDAEGEMHIDNIIQAHHDQSECGVSPHTHYSILEDYMNSTGSCFGKNWGIEDDLWLFCSATFPSLAEKDKILRTIVREAIELNKEAA